MMPMEKPDAMERIYKNRSRNRPNLNSDSAPLNLPTRAFASLPPSFVAQPFLRKVNGNLILNDEAVADEERENGETGRSIVDEYRGSGGVLQRLLHARNNGKCSPKTVITSCHEGECKPKVAKYKPGSRMDLVEFGDGNEHLISTEIDSAHGRPLSISQVNAQGSNNAFLSQYSKFVRANEKNRLLTQYNIGAPPFPKPCPATSFGQIPRFDAPTNEGEPIFIPNSVFDQSNDCGCNKRQVNNFYARSK